MSEKRKKPNYTEEFKQNAVSLVLEHGYNCHEAARRLDTPASNVSRWVRQHRQEQQGINQNGISCRDMQAEIRRLKKENQRLEMERDILKKAAAFFAKESK